MSVSPPSAATLNSGSLAAAHLPTSEKNEARANRFSSLFSGSMLALVLAVGVPIFLCMPLWFDVYHYDICARNLLRGGVPYRDIFDNNLPGIVWLQASVRWLVGWRPETLRVVDLVFFAINVALLLRWVRPGARVWTAAALSAFYLFVPESCPCQRDMWMLLPALIGLTLRQQQLQRFSLAPRLRAVVASSVLEGLCWGAAVWIKPFVFVPALACWVVSLLLVRRARTGRFRLLTLDALGLLTGGLLAGTLGLAWLWQSGSWPYFWDIMLGWNRDYAAYAHSSELRLTQYRNFLFRYLPWSLLALAAVYIALVRIARETLNRSATSEPATVPTGHALLSAFYLGWLVQAVCLQYPHEYVLTPALLPGITLVCAVYLLPRQAVLNATIRLGLVLMVVFWSGLFRPAQMALWTQCCREGRMPLVKEVAAARVGPYLHDPEALSQVAAYLRSQGAGDGEVTCQSGWTHPLYLELDLKPSTRFPQIEMTTLFFPSHRDDILAEINASHQRFVVSDLVWADLTPEEAKETDPLNPLALPPKFHEKFVATYPWCEPIVFRSGRYLVHRVTGPATKFWQDDKEARHAPR